MAVKLMNVITQYDTRAGIFKNREIPITATAVEQTKSSTYEWEMFSFPDIIVVKIPPHRPPNASAPCVKPYMVSDIPSTCVIRIGIPTIITALKTKLKTDTRKTTEKKMGFSVFTNCQLSFRSIPTTCNTPASRGRFSWGMQIKISIMAEKVKHAALKSKMDSMPQRV